MADEQALVQQATMGAEGLARIGRLAEVAATELASYHGHVETAQTRATELLERMNKELVEMQTTANTFVFNFNQLFKDAVLEVRELKQFADTSFGELGASLTENTGTLKEIQQHVESEKQKLDSGIRACMQAAQPLQDGLTSTQKRIDEALVAIHDKSDALSQQVAEAREKVGEMVEQLKDSVSSAKEEAESQLKEFDEKADSSQQKLQSKLESLSSEKVKSGVEDMLEKTTTAFQTDARKCIENAIEEVREQVDALTEKMTDGSSDSEALLRELQPIIDEVKDLLEPIESALEDAKEVVNSVPGVSWD